ncbi:Ig-like domain-containing protein [Pantoea sp. PNT03]|jgi:hypothetical protein|uniref:Ig-like domain-containing protein n=1 Tax=Pantoea sp. PNT03 TaxID=2769258 RepID=UPI00177F3CC7|nr:Ig-like domain-containing protein [Pantoea sp. PNT03]MBD9658386.1 hypothetical protein [Pantoea sp. PNT03]
MIDLFARSQTLYFESADGKLVFGNNEKLEPGGFIELVIGTDTFRVPVDDKGFYRWEAPSAYADGHYSFSIRHFDNAGNRNPPTLGTVIVDTSAPAAPELLNLYDDQGDKTGSFDAGKATDDKRPTLTGIAQKGSTVYLLNDKNEKIGSAVADKVTGKWVMEPAQDLKDGSNSLRLMAEETFGKQLRAGTPSAPFNIITGNGSAQVEHTGDAAAAPVSEAAPAATEPLARSKTLYFESADGKLVFGNKEKLEPGGFIELVIGTDIFRVPVNDEGFYRWEAPTPYADGEYSFSIRHFDNAGNRNPPTLGTMIVDTTAPDAPELINLYDDQGVVTGSFDAGKATDDKRPTLTGIAQKGSTVYLLNDKNEKIGSAVADKVTGKWVMAPSQDLKDGINSLRLMAEETFGKQLRAGAPSAAFDIVIAGDNVTVTITDAFDDAGSFTGALGNGALTDDATPTLRGEVSAADTVIVYYRLAGSPTWAGSATATLSGDTWSWTPGSNLPAGRYEFQASTGDVASALFELEIVSPSDIALRTRFETVIDDFGDATGLLESGAITDDATPTFQGRAEANSQVVIRYTLAGGAAASVTVDADSTGRWSWTPGTGLAAGQWSFDVKSLGQTHWNDSFDLIIVSESDGGFAPVIDYAVDDFGPVTGNLGSGGRTDDSTPALHGRAEANSLVILRYTLGDGRYDSASIKADAGGNWSWTPPELASGSWTFEVKKSGQMDWSSFTLTIDPNADRNASIDSALDNAGPVTGSLSSGASTDDTTPTLRGTGPASSVITLRYKMDGGSYASTTVSVDNAGNWSWTPSALVKGSWTFEVQKAGQSGWSSFRLTIDPDLDRYPTIDSALDNAGPVTGSLSSGASTDDTTPTLRGTGPANSVITLRYKLGNGGYTLDSASVDADGNWSWTPNTLAKGSWTFEVQKAGQSGWSSFKLTIDPALDLKPTIDSAWDDFGAVTGSLTSGDTTDDNTPTLRGTGVAGTIIHFQNGLAGGKWYDVGSTVVKADGTWEWTSPVLSKNGTWEFHAKAQNGDVISGWTGKFILKYVAAAGPVITDALDNVGPVTGSLNSGASTDDSTPTLRGTGPANSTITLRYKLGSGSYASTTVSVDNAGNWSWTPDTLAKGSWTFEVQNAGQSGWNSFQLTIDPDLDRYPTIDSALDNAGPVTGSLSSGATTDDTTPTLRGSGPANSVITLRYKLGSGNYASTTVSVDGNGKWTWTPSALANGSWTFEVQKAGQSGWSSFQLTIDPTVDRDAVINSAWDDFGAVTGTIANGGTTDDSTPTLRGTGPANSSITLKYSNGDRSGGIIVKVDASGNWTWTAPDLEDGHWTFEVKKDGQENWSRYELTIDSNADRNASIDGAFDNVGPVTGSLSSGSSTDDTTPTLRGSGPSSGTITLRYKLGTGSYASTTVSVDNAGNWSWTPSGLAKGSWTFEVQKAGQNGWSSFQLTIDPDLDRYPTIDSALDNVGPVTGSLSSGATTDDSTPTLRGSGPANSVITLRYKLGNGGYTIDSASVDASGNWSWTPNTLAKGSWTFEVQKDGQSGWSSFKLTIDPNLDRNATIDSAFDNVGPVTGSLSSGSSTDDTTPTLRGSGPASSTITLRYKLDGGSYASTTVSVDVNGTWSWTPNTLAKGSWTFEVQKSGQSGWSSFQLTIDPTVDRDAVINSAWDDFGAVTGTIANGGITDDSTPTLRGTGPANSTITLRYKLGTGSYASTTVSVDNAGNWSWTPSGLAKGSWTFEVQKAGQSGWSSFQLTIDPDLDRYPTIDSALDNVGPVTGSLSSGSSTDDSTPTLRGSGPANSVITLRYKLGSGSYASTTVSVDGNGKWTWTPSALANGSWTFEVQKAGQSGWSSFQLTIDPTVDRDAVITSAWDDFGAVTGTIANGGTTDDSTPTLRGTGPANSSISLKYSNGDRSGGIIVKVDASGNWTWTAPDLEDGHWTFEVKKDGQENWSRYELTIDSNADRNASIDSAFDNAGPVTGSLSSGASTDDTTPTLRGSGPANSTITLRYKMDGGSYASTTVSVDNAGNWSWTPSGLAKGSWTFEVQKSGQNGWSSFKLTIDPALDMQPTIDDAWDNFGAVTGSLKNGDTTDDSTPTLRGKGVAGTIIHIQSSPPGVPWEAVGSTVVRADGTWEWTSPALSGSNTWDFQARAQTGDHFSAWSNKFVVKYVAAAPDKPTITDAFDDVGPVTGSVKSEGYTDDSTPTLRGKGVAGSIIHFQNGPWNKPWVNVGSTVVKADGTWEWTSPALDHSDNWHFRVYVENSNGKSDWSDSFILNYTDPTPIIVDAFDDFGAQTGSLQNGDTTDDSTPTLRGRGVAGTIIHIQSSPPGVPWEPVGSTVVKADGTWEWTSPALSSSNTWDFQARAQNGDHYSAWSNKFVVKYVAAVPNKPVITDAFDDYGASTGSIANGGTTDDETPTLRGTGVPGSVVIVEYSLASGSWSDAGSAVVQANGKWEFTSPKLSENGDWEYRAKTIDGSSQSDWSNIFGVHFESSGASGGSKGVEDFESYDSGFGKSEDPINFNNGLKMESYYTYTYNGKPITRNLDTCVHTSPFTKGLIIIRIVDTGVMKQTMNRLSFGEETSAVSFGYTDSVFTTNKAMIYDKNHILIGVINFDKNKSDYKNVFFRAPYGKMIAYVDFDLENTSYSSSYPGYNRIQIDNLRWGDEAIKHHDNSVTSHEISPHDDVTQLAVDLDAVYSQEIHIGADEPHFDLHNLERAANSLTTLQLSEKGDVELTVSSEDILHLGQKDLFIEDGKTQLMVNGDAGDVVQLKDILPEGSDISEWQHQQGTVTVAGVEYEVYSHGDDAELLVQQGVKTELI